MVLSDSPSYESGVTSMTKKFNSINISNKESNNVKCVTDVDSHTRDDTHVNTSNERQDTDTDNCAVDSIFDAEVDNCSSDDDDYLPDDVSHRRCYSSEEEEIDDVQGDVSKYVANDVEEEMWDDDSDNYWDPSVRDFSWTLQTDIYNPHVVNSNPLPVIEGQFDDATEDESS